MIDQYTAGTHDDSLTDRPLVFIGASGKPSGHALVSWEPVTGEELPEQPPWRRGVDRPVIALLDSGVRPHSWLPDVAEDPFCIHLDEPEDVFDLDANGPDFGSHTGHATFIAGLIRLHAPDARVLSITVMQPNGAVRETDAIAALRRLADYVRDGGRVDAALLAFGRPVDEDDADPKKPAIRQAIADLNDLGVPVVASAGNKGLPTRTLPAYLATDTALRVTSVGAAGPVDGHADFSNYGPWVTEYLPGTDLLSIMPLQTVENGDDENVWARWSGTSFAAAIGVAQLVHSGTQEPTEGA